MYKGLQDVKSVFPLLVLSYGDLKGSILAWLGNTTDDLLWT